MENSSSSTKSVGFKKSISSPYDFLEQEIEELATFHLATGVEEEKEYNTASSEKCNRKERFSSPRNSESLNILFWHKAE